MLKHCRLKGRPDLPPVALLYLVLHVSKLLEAQEKEVNEFVEEERKTLVNTAKDLETQVC